MNFKQIFCKHVWKTDFVRLISSSIGYVGDIPVREFKEYSVTRSCLKCKKSKIEKQEWSRILTFKEVDELVSREYWRKISY